MFKINVFFYGSNSLYFILKFNGIYHVHDYTLLSYLMALAYKVGQAPCKINELDMDHSFQLDLPSPLYAKIFLIYIINSSIP